MVPSPMHLCPIPKRARTTGRSFGLDVEKSWGLPLPSGLSAVLSAAEGVCRELERLGVRVDSGGSGPSLVDFRRRGGFDGEAYGLEIGRDVDSSDKAPILLSYGSSVGAFRGLTTLAQWLRLHSMNPAIETLTIRGVEIEDRPDFAARGFLLDISRNRVPKMAELRDLIELMADLKYNQLQLYTEHTFAYPGHERVWQGWSPMTSEQILEIARYAEERFIEWVPNQNCFGHLHRWLVHEPYRRLAESPDGIAHPFSLHREPFSLCPTDPGSLALVEDWLDQLLPLAKAPIFNANLDETLDLGLGRSKAICERRGTEQVYLDFVHQIHRRVAAHGKRMMMWGDIILKRPDLIDRLPDDVALLEWGYEADHPFDRDCERFAAAGREVYVCPGTSSWSSFSGRTENMVQNLASAAVHGRAHGAAGYLVTDWGDHGHLQPPIIGRPGLLAGSCFSWNAESAKDSQALPLAEMLDAHLLRDSAGRSGRALLDLGRVQDETGLRPLNGSPFFFEIMQAHLPLEERRSRGLTVGSVEKALLRLDEVMADWNQGDIDRPDALLLTRELEWVAQALRFGAQLSLARLELGADRPLAELVPAQRQDLDRRLCELVDALRPIWRERSRPGGLEASIDRLTAPRALWSE